MTIWPQLIFCSHIASQHANRTRACSKSRNIFMSRLKGDRSPAFSDEQAMIVNHWPFHSRNIPTQKASREERPALRTAAQERVNPAQCFREPFIGGGCWTMVTGKPANLKRCRSRKIRQRIGAAPNLRQNLIKRFFHREDHRNGRLFTKLLHDTKRIEGLSQSIQASCGTLASVRCDGHSNRR